MVQVRRLGQKEVVSLLGPPGAGKGTVAQAWRAQEPLASLCTGDLCREHVRKETRLGKELGRYISVGQLVPDELISAMVAEWLADAIKEEVPVVLDGYPRTAPQVGHLLEMLAEYAPTYTLRVVLFDIPLSVVIDRLLNRIVCPNSACLRVYSGKLLVGTSVCPACSAPLQQRSDDERQVIERRLLGYEQNKTALLKAYAHAGIAVDVFPVEQVPYTDMFRAFSELMTRRQK